MKLFLMQSDDLLIRNFKLSDINQNYIDFLNDKNLLKYSNNKYTNFTKKKCLLFFKNFKNSKNLFLAILSKKNLKLIGTLTCYFSNNMQICDVGILLGHKNYRSKKLGTKAWIMIMDFLKKNYKLKKISAGTVVKNVKMIKIFKRSGMVYDGFRRKNFYEKKLLDLVFYAKYL